MPQHWGTIAARPQATLVNTSLESSGLSTCHTMAAVSASASNSTTYSRAMAMPTGTARSLSPSVNLYRTPRGPLG